MALRLIAKYFLNVFWLEMVEIELLHVVGRNSSLRGKYLGGRLRVWCLGFHFVSRFGKLNETDDTDTCKQSEQCFV